MTPPSPPPPPPAVVQEYRSVWAGVVSSIPEYDDGGTGERATRVATLRSMLEDAEALAWLVVINRDVVGPSLATWYAEEVAGDLREIQATLALEHRYSLQRVAIENVEGKLRGDVAKAAATARRALEVTEGQERQRIRNNDAAKGALVGAEAAARDIVGTAYAESWAGLLAMGRRWLAEAATQARQRDEHAAAVTATLLLPSLVAAEGLVRDAIIRCRDRTVDAIRDRYPSAAGCPRFCTRSGLTAAALWARATTPPTGKRLGCHASPSSERGPKYIERSSDDLATLRETLSRAARREQRRGVRRRREEALGHRRHVVGPARDLARLVARVRLGFDGRAALFAKHAALIRRKRAVLTIGEWYRTCLGRREAWRRVRALIAAQHEVQRRQLQFERHCVLWEMARRVQTSLRAQGSDAIVQRKRAETAEICTRRLQRFMRSRIARAALRRRYYGWQVRHARRVHDEQQRDAATRIAAHWRRWLAVREYRRHALPQAEQRRVAGNVRELFEQSVTLVQSAYRRVMAQRQLAARIADAAVRTATSEAAEVANYCAREVQRVFRGHRGRRSARQVRAQKIQREIDRLSAQLHAARGGVDASSDSNSPTSRPPHRDLAVASPVAERSASFAGGGAQLNNSKVARAERLRRAILATQQQQQQQQHQVVAAVSTPVAAATPPPPQPTSPGAATSPTKRGWARVSRVLLGSSGAASRRGASTANDNHQRASDAAKDESPSPAPPVTAETSASSAPGAKLAASGSDAPAIPPPPPSSPLARPPSSASSPFYSIIGLVRSRADRPGESTRVAKTARGVGGEPNRPSSASAVGASGAATAVQVVVARLKTKHAASSQRPCRQRPRSASGVRRPTRDPSSAEPRAASPYRSGGPLTSETLWKHRKQHQRSAEPEAAGPGRRAATHRVDPTAAIADVGGAPPLHGDGDFRRIAGNRAVVAAALLRKGQQQGGGAGGTAERRRSSSAADEATSTNSSVLRPQQTMAAMSTSATASSLMADSLRAAVERQRRRQRQ